jgi:hypothetical protein
MSGEQETIDDLHPHREIAEFIAEGLANGDPVVVIATPESRRAIEAHLRSRGSDRVELDRHRGARWIDSREMLERILVDGMPDKDAFDEAMAAILFNGFSKSSARRTRVYHDLVDVLRDRGSLDAAVLLLRLWSNLCARYEDLLLAYTVAEWYREKDCAV